MMLILMLISVCFNGNGNDDDACRTVSSSTEARSMSDMETLLHGFKTSFPMLR